METIKIRRDGGILLVNLAMVCTIEQTGEDSFVLRTQDGRELAVAGRRELDAVLSADTSAQGLRREVRKLAEALERLSARIPSSLRVHF